jgi:hypothetical protein
MLLDINLHIDILMQLTANPFQALKGCAATAKGLEDVGQTVYRS